MINLSILFVLLFSTIFALYKIQLFELIFTFSLVIILIKLKFRENSNKIYDKEIAPHLDNLNKNFFPEEIYDFLTGNFEVKDLENNSWLEKVK